jgi:hypothetical protein
VADPLAAAQSAPPATRPTPPNLGPSQSRDQAPVQNPAQSPARNPNLTLSDDRQAAETAPQAVPEDPEDRPAPIELDPPILDFGFVEPGKTPKKTVRLKNTGTEPLMILAIQPSCKCTTINDLVGEEIAPGEFLELEASMKAQSAPGPKKADIKVLFDGFSRVVNIQLQMEVTLPIRVVPGYINAVKGQPQTGRYVVESLDKQPFSIASVHGRPPRFIGFDPANDEPRNQYLVAYDVSDFREGEMPLFMIIETDHPSCPLVDVRLRHEFTFPKPVLKMQEYRHTIGRIEEGQTSEIVLEIGELPPEEPVISVASTFPGVRMELVGEAEKEGIITRYTVKVTPPAGFHGLLYAPFTVYTTRRQQDMFVWGLVVPKGHTGTLGPMEIVPGTCAMKWTGKPASAASAAAPAPAPAAR